MPEKINSLALTGGRKSIPSRGRRQESIPYTGAAKDAFPPPLRGRVRVGVLMQPSDEKLSRRELLRGPWAKQKVFPAIDGEKCTGCGLCALRCEPSALAVVQDDEEEAYKLVFTHDLCTACGNCATACPEKCLTLQKFSEEGTREPSIVVFEDEMTRCSECGVLMFPAAMVRHLREKTRAAGTGEIPFDLCPECRMKRQIVRKTLH